MRLAQNFSYLKKSTASFVLFLFFSVPAFAESRYILLSGGGMPGNTVYSQYVQTKALYDFLYSKRTPNSRVDVLFGAGNQSKDKEKIKIADVYHMKSFNNEQNQMVMMIPGVISNNLSSKKEALLKVFEETRNRTVNEHDQLFFFVSGSGMLNKTSDGADDSTHLNNCIDMWGFETDASFSKYWSRPFGKRCLSVSDLAHQFQEHVPEKRVIYAMSQCYAGGFHRLAVRTGPDGFPTKHGKACGFSATTDDSISSACLKTASEVSHLGYEHYLTAEIMGKDIATSQPKTSPAKTILEAHQEATVALISRDIPLSSSEFFLWQWAKVIETKNFRPRYGSFSVYEIFQLYSRYTDIKPKKPSYEYATFHKYMMRNYKAIVQIYPDLEATLQKGLLAHRMKLAALVKEEQALRRDLLVQESKLRRLRQDVLLPAWRQVYESNPQNLGLTADELWAEKNIYQPNEKRLKQEKDITIAMEDMLTNYLSMITPAKPERAKQIAEYQAVRESRMMDWASKNKDPRRQQLAYDVTRHAEDNSKLRQQILEVQKQYGLVRRMLIYRQILGAIVALESMPDYKALRDLKDLRNCESAKLN